MSMLAYVCVANALKYKNRFSANCVGSKKKKSKKACKKEKTNPNKEDEDISHDQNLPSHIERLDTDNI